MSEDFDALFEEISAQRADTPQAPTTTPSPAPETAEQNNNTPLANETQDSQDVTDKPMFERLGGIVRQLHDSMRELGFDRSLSEAASQITDAQGRLEHIAKLTEQAANKVLNTIDEGMPALDELSKNAKTIGGRWESLFSGQLSVDEFKLLAGDSKQFASDVETASETEKSRLLSIMMAQDFQDITGQLIKKIIIITQKVESDLAQLLRDNAPPELIKEKPVELMQGPSVTAMGQDDVDSLLDDLGF